VDFYLRLHTVLQNKKNYLQNSNDSAQYEEIIAPTIQELAEVATVALTFQHTRGGRVPDHSPHISLPAHALVHQQLYDPFRVNLKYESATASSNFPSKRILVKFILQSC